jgi:hypothetical protein
MTASRSRSRAACAHPSPSHTVVACLLFNAGRICLLRRSSGVSFDRGKWHCITGYLAPDIDPLEQALTEIREEVGLLSGAAQLVSRHASLSLQGDGCTWRVFPFLFETTNPVLELNWENDAYRWVDPVELGKPGTVAWLTHVCGALGVVQPPPANPNLTARTAQAQRRSTHVG